VEHQHLEYKCLIHFKINGYLYQQNSFLVKDKMVEQYSMIIKKYLFLEMIIKKEINL